MMSNSKKNVEEITDNDLELTNTLPVIAKFVVLKEETPTKVFRVEMATLPGYTLTPEQTLIREENLVSEDAALLLLHSKNIVIQTINDKLIAATNLIEDYKHKQEFMGGMFRVATDCNEEDSISDSNSNVTEVVVKRDFTKFAISMFLYVVAQLIAVTSILSLLEWYNGHDTVMSPFVSILLLVASPFLILITTRLRDESHLVAKGE